MVSRAVIAPCFSAEGRCERRNFYVADTETRIDSTDGVLDDRLLQSSRLLPHQFLETLVFSKPAGEADNPPHSVIFVWQTITGVT
jgi:hypothetical protein